MGVSGTKPGLLLYSEAPPASPTAAHTRRPPPQHPHSPVIDEGPMQCLLSCLGLLGLAASLSRCICLSQGGGSLRSRAGGGMQCEAEWRSVRVWSPALLALLLTHPGKWTVQTRALILCGL